MKQEYDIVMLALNNIQFDSRVRREAQALGAAGWGVLVIGTQRTDGALPDREAVDGYTISRVRYGRFGARLWRPWSWLRHGLQAMQVIRAARRVQTRAYHAHDFPALILLSLARVGRGSRVRLIYDAHELYLFQTRYTSRITKSWHRLTRPVFMALEGYLARRTDAIITVCEPMARLMSGWYGVPRPIVVWNAVDASESGTPLESPSRGRYLAHTGRVTNQGRCLSELIEAMTALPDDLSLVFLGPSRSGETQGLVALSKQLGIGDRVWFLPPVSPEQVAGTIRTAAAAIVLMRPDSLNMRLALPVKFFEAVGAGVPIIASNQFTLARLVRRFGLGVICNPIDPLAIAAAVARILDPINQSQYREQVRVAQAVISWRNQSAQLRVLYQRLLSG